MAICPKCGKPLKVRRTDVELIEDGPPIAPPPRVAAYTCAVCGAVLSVAEHPSDLVARIAGRVRG